MDKTAQDVHIIMNGEEIVLRLIHIVNMNIYSGFIKIDYTVNNNLSKSLLIPCLEGIKITID